MTKQSFSTALRCGVIAVGFLLQLDRSFGQDTSWRPERTDGTIRIASFNVSMNRSRSGRLRRDLETGDNQISRVAAAIRAVRPDVLLLNEVDFDGQSPSTAELFATKYLADASQDSLGGQAWEMPYVFVAPVNTGVPSGLDVNQNGKLDEPDDSWGYGRFPGQYAMAVLSRTPIATDSVIEMKYLLWASMPNAQRPMFADRSFYPDATWEKLRLSSKSFWDVPVSTAVGAVHIIASHPTPPAFDGPEDRNGCRNHDEIRLITDYIDAAGYLARSGNAKGLGGNERFAVLGDLNSDPADGGSQSAAIKRLIEHPRIAQFDTPASRGAVSATERQGKANKQHRGNPAHDTADFSDGQVGNLRVDYALPSRNLKVAAAGVFWPDLSEVEPGLRNAMLDVLRASDHHLVWVDVLAP